MCHCMAWLHFQLKDGPVHHTKQIKYVEPQADFFLSHLYLLNHSTCDRLTGMSGYLDTV
jgi:hypothetical protein